MAKIVLGVTGGIAAYKALSVLSGLQKTGHEVRVVMTPAAEKMIQPHSFASLSHNIVYTDRFWMENTGKIDHIDLASWLDHLLIAPATANTIAKIAYGIADNLLTATAIATPVNEHTHRVICPAMNHHMYISAPMVRNYCLLKSDGWEIIKPVHGEMACGSTGIGVLPTPRKIVEHMNETIK